MNCFILDEGGSCYKNDGIRFFFEDVAEHKSCKTMNVKVMLLFLLVSSELLNFEDEISIRRGECSDPNN